MTTTILIAIAAFLVITLVLVALLLYAKAKLTSSGEVTIDINNGEKVIRTESGSTLLATLANNKVFLPSPAAVAARAACASARCWRAAATSCRPRPVSSRARWPRTTGVWAARSR